MYATAGKCIGTCNKSYISKCCPGARGRPADTAVVGRRISIRSDRPWVGCRPCPARYRAQATDCRSLPQDRRSACRRRRRRHYAAGNVVLPSLTGPPSRLHYDARRSSYRAVISYTDESHLSIRGRLKKETSKTLDCAVVIMGRSTTVDGSIKSVGQQVESRDRRCRSDWRWRANDNTCANNLPRHRNQCRNTDVPAGGGGGYDDAGGGDARLPTTLRGLHALYTRPSGEARPCHWWRGDVCSLLLTDRFRNGRDRGRHDAISLWRPTETRPLSGKVVWRKKISHVNIVTTFRTNCGKFTTETAPGETRLDWRMQTHGSLPVL